MQLAGGVHQKTTCTSENESGSTVTSARAQQSLGPFPFPLPNLALGSETWHLQYVGEVLKHNCLL